MTLFWIGAGLWAYAYAGYPLLLIARASGRIRSRPPEPPTRPPVVSITLCVYNEAYAIAQTLEALLAVDWPSEHRQILVVSDGSTDRTESIVAGFATRGVELLPLRERKGKTAAENAARAHLRGEIIVNTDASVRVHPASVRRLVDAMADPSVGVASSRDVSVSSFDDAGNPGEAAYVGYEMWVRTLETRAGGIVGASGCLYAIRAELHRRPLPEVLSRDFSAALVARASGYRAVSVPDAVCFVPRSSSLRREYRRKVRTMARGLATLVYWRALLDPFKHGDFAWKLASHKLCRWLLPWASVAMVASLASAAMHEPIARVALGFVGAGTAWGIAGWLWSPDRPLPRVVAIPAFTIAGIAAGLHAWVRLLRGRHTATWEPTQRGPAPTT